MRDCWSRLTVLVVVIVVVVVGVELANAGRTFGELGAGALGVADAVDFLTVAAVGVVAGASGVDHRLADRAALLRDIVVVKLLCRDRAESGEAEEEEAVPVKHRCGSVVRLWCVGYASVISLLMLCAVNQSQIEGQTELLIPAFLALYQFPSKGHSPPRKPSTRTLDRRSTGPSSATNNRDERRVSA